MGNLLKLFCTCVTLGVTVVAQAAEVNVYSARKEALIKPLLDRFTEQTGIEVNLVTGKADALLQRIQAEGANTPADLLITVDAGRLHRAKAADLLDAVSSDALTRAVPENYRDPKGSWYGLSLRTRFIVVVEGKVDPADVTRYEDLADPKWKGRICIRSSNNIYNQSLAASMIAVQGEAETEAWARGLVANLARNPKGGDRDQVKAAAAGQCDIAVINNYYLGRMLSSDDEAQKSAAEKMRIVWPNQADRGTHVNISGGAVIKGAKNKDNAIKLLEFLVSQEAQQYYAESNYEYPVKAGVPVSPMLTAWGDFKRDDLNLAKLGEFNAAAVKLMDRAGWR